MWVDGEPNGRSEVGDDDKEDDKEDGKDGSEEFVGVGGSVDDAVMVADQSRAAAVLEINCPLYRGWEAQCLEFVGASLSFIEPYTTQTRCTGFLSQIRLVR